MADTRIAILDALAESPRSGESLADDLDVTRAAVWKHVEALREQGFEIESTDDGYVLGDVPEYGGDAIQFGLDAPFEIEFHESVGSTNDVARDRAADGESDLVIVANEQTGGKGRLDREWASPEGGIWLSILLRPDQPPATVSRFTLAAAVAITAAAREAGVDAGIKWPNDVLVSEPRRASEGSLDERGESSGVLVREHERPNQGSLDEQRASSGVLVSESRRTNEGSSESLRSSDGVQVASDDEGNVKLSGVLTEMEGEANRVEWLVIGMGVNANLDAADLPERATSVRQEIGEDVNRRLFVQRVLETFDDLRNDPDAILDAWREDALTLDREVRVDTASGETIVGTATDVEHPGRLVVETADGTKRVHAGDCEHLRPT